MLQLRGRRRLALLTVGLSICASATLVVCQNNADNLNLDLVIAAAVAADGGQG